MSSSASRGGLEAGRLHHRRDQRTSRSGSRQGSLEDESSLSQVPPVEGDGRRPRRCLASCAAVAFSAAGAAALLVAYAAACAVIFTTVEGDNGKNNFQVKSSKCFMPPKNSIVN